MNKTDFTTAVQQVVGKIPAGKTMTYKEVADAAGFPGAARAVGSVMARNNDLNIPCHRVIRSDGTIGPYNGLRGKSKEQLLKEEGAL